MRPSKLPCLMTALATLLSVQAAQADFIIDNFTANVFTQNSSAAINDNGLVMTDTIGGSRTVNYNQASDVNGGVAVTDGTFEFIAQANNTARVTIIWDGNANQTLDTTHYPVLPNDFRLAADFNANPLVRFKVPFVPSGGDAMIFRLYGASSANFLEWDVPIDSATVTGGFLDIDVLNDPVSPNSSGPVDLSDVQAITVSLLSLGLDHPNRIDFDFIDAQDPAPVPEPGTLALLGAVFGTTITYRWQQGRLHFPAFRSVSFSCRGPSSPGH